MSDAPITDLTTLEDSARRQLRAIDEELAGLHDRVRELREVRARINRFLGPIGGAGAHKPKISGGSESVSNATLDQLTGWLRANVNGRDFVSTEIYEQVAIDGLGSLSRVNIALGKLHDRGIVRLVKATGGGKTGRAKVWAVTNAAS